MTMLDDDGPMRLDRPTFEDDDPGLETRALYARLQERMFDTATPVRIGDYVVVKPLGEGAMGTVFLAYDPDLDRRVAIKVLRQAASGPDEPATIRMEREAKAMARLAHPNVVAVHEVGVSEGQIFVAMEYVEGCTLAAWCRTHPIDSKGRLVEVLSLAVQAARGLAAAHGAGLIHRDLKPANILVGDDGRLRIADFGLARPQGEGEPMERSLPGAPTDEGLDLAVVETRAASGPVGSDSRLTATGEIIGTPAYMAPEQWKGHSDERSDQFGWCATVFEALYGVRPFAGSTFQALLTAVQEGTLVKPPSNAHVPGWLRRLLERGLASDPTARWPDMNAIVTELTRRGRSSWRRALVGAGLVALGVASALLVVEQTSHSDPERTTVDCPSAAPRLEPAWGAERKSAIHQAFGVSGAPYAQDAWVRVEEGLDAVAHDWVRAQSEVCHAAASADPERAALAQRRTACLERSLRAIEFASDQLTRADAETVRLSALTVAGLRDRVRCDEVALLTTTDGDGNGDIIDATLATLDQAEVLRDLHRLSNARTMLDDALAQIPEDGFISLHARTYKALVDVAIRAEDWPAVASNSGHLLDYAERSADPGLHASAWVNLAIVARNDKRFEEAEFRLARAQNIATHNRVADTLLAHVAQGYAALYGAQQLHGKALVKNRETIEILERGAPDSIEVAYALRSLAESMFGYGEGQASIEALERSLAIHQRVLGPDHPDTAMAHLTLANIQVRLRDEDTLGHIAEAERILRANPEYHPSGLGRVHELRGLDMLSRSGADADGELAKAQEIFARTLGPDHGSVFHVRLFRANALHASKRNEEAATAYRSLVEEFAPGDDMPVTFANARMNLADVEAVLGNHAFALAQLALARPVFDETFGARGTIWRNTFINFARVYRNAGHPELATAMLQEIDDAAAAAKEPIPAHERLWLRIEQARAALGSGDRSTAIEITRTARAEMQGEDPKDSLLEDLAGLEQTLGIEAPSE